MATYLTTEALQHLLADPKLQADICNHIGVDLGGVKSAIIRNSKSLTTYCAVIKIAEAMEKRPTEILQELPN